MDSKQTEEAKRAVRVLTFAEGRAADFQHRPAKPVDAKHAATITKLDGIIKELGGKEAIQQANTFGQATEEQRADRGDVGSTIRKINKTMATITDQRKQPGLMDRFRMPHGNGDTELAAKLRGFADAIEELDLADALAEHNFVLTTDELRQMADDLTSGTGDQGVARSKQTGATARIPELLGQARECMKTFDAIYGNTYDDDTETLTAWRSASHVPRKRSPGKKKKKPDEGTTGSSSSSGAPA